MSLGGTARDAGAAGDDDVALVAMAQGGDAGALDTLLRRHHPRLRVLCLRLTGNPADADDACQEALIAVARGLARFDGRSSFATWAYRVTTNTCLDELRRRRRRPVPGLPDDGDDTGAGRQGGPPSGAASPARDTADEVADRVDIDAALARLAPEFRAAVVLRDLCRLSYAEIADVVDVPVGTVRSRIARGRAALLEALTGNSPTADQRPSPR
ncbi:MAG: RNA polymerase sigma factor [Acidimicrobiales bacterium]